MKNSLSLMSICLDNYKILFIYKNKQQRTKGKIYKSSAEFLRICTQIEKKIKHQCKNKY